MRGVHNDDLLLSRGANPRTGAISPEKPRSTQGTGPKQRQQPEQTTSSPKWQQKGDQWISIKNKPPLYGHQHQFPYHRNSPRGQCDTGLRLPPKLRAAAVQAPSGQTLPYASLEVARSCHARYADPEQLPQSNQQVTTRRFVCEGDFLPISDPTTKRILVSPQTSPSSFASGSQALRTPPPANKVGGHGSGLRSSSAPTPRKGINARVELTKDLPPLPKLARQYATINVVRGQQPCLPRNNRIERAIPMPRNGDNKHPMPRTEKALPTLPASGERSGPEVSMQHLPAGTRSGGVLQYINFAVSGPSQNSPLDSGLTARPLLQPGDGSGGQWAAGTDIPCRELRKLRNIAATPVYDNPPKHAVTPLSPNHCAGSKVMPPTAIIWSGTDEHHSHLSSTCDNFRLVDEPQMEPNQLFPPRPNKSYQQTPTVAPRTHCNHQKSQQASPPYTEQFPSIPFASDQSPTGLAAMARRRNSVASISEVANSIHGKQQRCSRDQLGSVPRQPFRNSTESEISEARRSSMGADGPQVVPLFTTKSSFCSIQPSRKASEAERAPSPPHLINHSHPWHYEGACIIPENDHLHPVSPHVSGQSSLSDATSNPFVISRLSEHANCCERCCRNGCHNGCQGHPDLHQVVEVASSDYSVAALSSSGSTSPDLFSTLTTSSISSTDNTADPSVLAKARSRQRILPASHVSTSAKMATTQSVEHGKTNFLTRSTVKACSNAVQQNTQSSSGALSAARKAIELCPQSKDRHNPRRNQIDVKKTRSSLTSSLGQKNDKSAACHSTNTDHLLAARKVTPLTGWTKVSSKRHSNMGKDVYDVGEHLLKPSSVTEFFELALIPVAVVQMWLTKNPRVLRGIRIAFKHYWNMSLDIQKTSQIILGMVYTYSKNGDIMIPKDLTAPELLRDCFKSALYMMIIVATISVLRRMVQVLMLPLVAVTWVLKVINIGVGLQIKPQ